jgi:hypothetical protein
MSKMRKNRDVPHIGRTLADRAAAIGPLPDDRLKGSISMHSVVDGTAVQLFPNAIGPKGGRNHPKEPGTDIFQRLKLTTGGPKGKTDPRDF